MLSQSHSHSSPLRNVSVVLIQLQASNRNPPSAGLTTQISAPWTCPHQTTALFALLFCLKGVSTIRTIKYPSGTGKISRISIATTPQLETGKKILTTKPVVHLLMINKNWKFSSSLSMSSPQPLQHSSLHKILPQTSLFHLPESTCNPTEAAWQVTDTCHGERKDYSEQNIQGKTNDSAGYRIKMRVGK